MGPSEDLNPGVSTALSRQSGKNIYGRRRGRSLPEFPAKPGNKRGSFAVAGYFARRMALLLCISNLERHTPSRGFPRAMGHPRGPTGILPRLEFFIEPQIDNASFQYVDFLPKVMSQYAVRRRVTTRLKS